MTFSFSLTVMVYYTPETHVNNKLSKMTSQSMVHIVDNIQSGGSVIVDVSVQWQANKETRESFHFPSNGRHQISLQQDLQHFYCYI